MACKGICGRHKASRPKQGNRYGDPEKGGDGQKRCIMCEIFIKWDGMFCPCCSYKLRVKPRNLNKGNSRYAKRKNAITTAIIEEEVTITEEELMKKDLEVINVYDPMTNTVKNLITGVVTQLDEKGKPVVIAS